MTGTWDFDRARAAWWAIGAALGATILFVVYSFVGTFVFGVFLYYATRPLYRRLKRHVKPPSVAAGAALVLLALPALLLAAYTGAIGLQEFNRAVTNLAASGDLAGLQARLQPYVDLSKIASSPEQLLSQPNAALVERTLKTGVKYVGVIGTAALHLFVMIALAFYLLRDDHKLSRFFRRRFADDSGVLESYLAQVDQDLNSVFFGNILNALITGTIGALSYTVLDMVAPAPLDIPYPMLLGLLAGVASLIPIVGMKLVYVPVTAYIGGVTLVNGLPELFWFPVVVFAVSLVVVDTIPDLVLRPYVSGRNLHVGLVMLAYILGPLLFGWYGIFLGPMLLVFVVHFARVVLPELVAGRPIQPWAVDPTYMRSLSPAEPAEETPPTPTDGGEPPEEVAESSDDEVVGDPPST